VIVARGITAHARWRWWAARVDGRPANGGNSRDGGGVEVAHVAPSMSSSKLNGVSVL